MGRLLELERERDRKPEIAGAYVSFKFSESAEKAFEAGDAGELSWRVKYTEGQSGTTFTEPPRTNLLSKHYMNNAEKKAVLATSGESQVNLRRRRYNPGGYPSRNPRYTSLRSGRRSSSRSPPRRRRSSRSEEKPRTQSLPSDRWRPRSASESDGSRSRSRSRSRNKRR